MSNPSRLLPALAITIYSAALTLGAFSGGLWAALGIGGALLFLLLYLIGIKKIPYPPKDLTLFTFFALSFFAAELPLSSHIDISIKVWAQLLSIFLPLLLLTSPALQEKLFSEKFVPAVSIAAAIGAIALTLELQSGAFLLHTFKNPSASLTEYNRGIAHVVIVSFALFAGLKARSVPKAFALFLIILLPTVFAESHTAKLALLVGSLVTVAALYRADLVKRCFTVALFLLIGWPLYAELLFSYAPQLIASLPPSWRERVEIWDYLSYRIAEKPLFGWGLGTTHKLDRMDPHGNLYALATQNAAHAHNFIVCLWVETGILGLMIGISFLMLILRAIAELHKSLRPFALGGLAAAIIVSLFGFDFWTDALWATFALSACAFAMLDQRLKVLKHI